MAEQDDLIARLTAELGDDDGLPIVTASKSLLREVRAALVAQQQEIEATDEVLHDTQEQFGRHMVEWNNMRDRAEQAEAQLRAARAALVAQREELIRERDKAETFHSEVHRLEAQLRVEVRLRTEDAAAKLEAEAQLREAEARVWQLGEERDRLYEKHVGKEATTDEALARLELKVEAAEVALNCFDDLRACQWPLAVNPERWIADTKAPFQQLIDTLRALRTGEPGGAGGPAA